MLFDELFGVGTGRHLVIALKNLIREDMLVALKVDELALTFTAEPVGVKQFFGSVFFGRVRRTTDL